MARRKKNTSRDPAPTQPPAPGPRISRWEFAGLVLLAVATLVVYWPAMHGEPVWDDAGHLTKLELRSTEGFYRIWFEPGATQQYYPLLHSAFWLEHQLWGADTFGYHLANVLQHITAAALVFLILKKLQIPGALLAAAIFALHPVQVESVAWITEQKNTLSAVFYLGAMLAYLEFDERRDWSLYGISFALFMLGLMTKTVTATLPAALLVIFWWRRGKLSIDRDVLPLIPFFLLGAVAGAFTAYVERNLIGAKGEGYDLSFLQRGLIAGRVIWFYLAKLLWPQHLSFIYPRWDVDPTVWWQWLFPIAVFAALFVLWSIRGHWRAPLAGALLFVGTLFPVLGFLNVYPFIYSFVADHFQYLACLGVITLVAAGVAIGIARLQPNWRLPAQMACISVLAVLASLSWRQSHIYRDITTLYEATIRSNPNCWMAYNNLGIIWADLGDSQKAIHCYQQSLRIRPDYSEAHNNLGVQLENAGQFDEARKHFEAALKSRPDYDGAHNNLGVVLKDLGRVNESIPHFERALSLNARYADAHVNLGDALRLLGRNDEAAMHFEEAMRMNPNDAETFNNYAILLLGTGQAEKAREYLERAVEIKPDYVDAQNNLGLVLAKLDRMPEAIPHFQRAVVLDPNYGDARVNLANALLQTGRPAEAVPQYQQAIRLRPNDPHVRVNLMYAYIELGRAQEALAVARDALQLAESAGDADLVAQLKAWLARQAPPSPNRPKSSANPPSQ